MIGPDATVTPRAHNTKVQKKSDDWCCSQCFRPLEHVHLLSMRERRSDPYPVCDACTDELRTANGFKPLGEYQYDGFYEQEQLDVDIIARRVRGYRLTVAGFLAMLEAQDKRCAICRHHPRTAADFVIDHNHKTGVVRGLLCSKCNTALGMFQDSPDVLDAAIEYLEEHGCYGQDSLKEDAS